MSASLNDILFSAMGGVNASPACIWVTRDKDFGGFAPHGLRWQHLVLP